MTPISTSSPADATARPTRFSVRTRSGRLIASSLVVGLTCTGLAVSSGQTAGAAALPQAQSVGNFLDATLGGKPLDDVAKLKYATAFAPGTTSVQNPLDATALNAVNLPLTTDLQLPEIGGITLGAANQVAVAKADGYSYGASGAVDNSGGASIGGDNAAFPADATINLNAASLASNSPIRIPGGTTSADALGGVTATIGAVSSLAQTPAGVGQPGATSYGIAGLDLKIGSPLVGGILKPVTSAATSLLNALSNAGKAVGLSLPASCTLASGTLPDIQLEKDSDGVYAVTISSDGTITVDLEALLKVLGLDLNTLNPNTDLVDYLLTYLTSPSGLSSALPAAITGLTSSLQSQLTACAPGALAPLLAALTALQGTFTGSLTDLAKNLASSAGVNPLAPIGTALKNLIDIGVNVQPNGPKGTFTSALAATPKQGTAVVPGQTIVRAIEIDLVGDPLAVISLANSAAGPSAAAPVTPTTPATTPASPAGSPGTAIPTGVPAGFDKQPGAPELPLILLIVGLVMASGGAVAWKIRLNRVH